MAVKASLFDDKEKLDSSHANSCHMSANPKRWRFQGFQARQATTLKIQFLQMSFVFLDVRSTVTSVFNCFGSMLLPRTFREIFMESRPDMLQVWGRESASSHTLTEANQFCFKLGKLLYLLKKAIPYSSNSLNV